LIEFFSRRREARRRVRESARPQDLGRHDAKCDRRNPRNAAARDRSVTAWLGRNDNTIDDWQTLREEAARAHSTRTTHTANYLLGMPLVSDCLEEGLSLFGLSCEDFEINRL
jgi:hypothetical protein